MGSGSVCSGKLATLNITRTQLDQSSVKILTVSFQVHGQQMTTAAVAAKLLTCQASIVEGHSVPAVSQVHVHSLLLYQRPAVHLPGLSIH